MNLEGDEPLRLWLARAPQARLSPRVTRTIADLAGEGGVAPRHLAEALQYRAYEARRASVR